jgi:hypothetical protein
VLQILECGGKSGGCLYQGKLKITKRGPSLARRWLYFAALRHVQKRPVQNWYEAKKQKDGNHGSRAVVAVMRKLALAQYAVACGQKFSADRLFPGRPPQPADATQWTNPNFLS